MSGQEEYEHMMFITSDFTKANEFCKKYNDHMYEDTYYYDRHHAYVKEILDYVPDLPEDFYKCDTVVYTINADKEKNIDENDIIGLPIFDYIDFRLQYFDFLKTDDPEELLEILMDARCLASKVDNGFQIHIVVVNKGMKPFTDYIRSDEIHPDLKANLITKAKELLKNMR